MSTVPSIPDSRSSLCQSGAWDRPRPGAPTVPFLLDRNHFVQGRQVRAGSRLGMLEVKIPPGWENFIPVILPESSASNLSFMLESRGRLQMPRHPVFRS